MGAMSDPDYWSEFDNQDDLSLTQILRGRREARIGCRPEFEADGSLRIETKPDYGWLGAFLDCLAEGRGFSLRPPL